MKTLIFMPTNANIKGQLELQVDEDYTDLPMDLEVIYHQLSEHGEWLEK